MSATTVIDQVKSWLTPMLIVLLGFLIKDKLNDIDSKLNLIPGIQGQVTVLNVRIDNTSAGVIDNKLAITSLQHDFYEHVAAKKDDDPLNLNGKKQIK